MQFDAEANVALVSRSDFLTLLNGHRQGDIVDLDDDDLSEDIDLEDVRILGTSDCVEGFMADYLGLDPRFDALPMRGYNMIEVSALGAIGLLNNSSAAVATKSLAAQNPEIEALHRELMEIYKTQTAAGLWQTAEELGW